MKIKMMKILLSFFIILSLVGCMNIEELEKEEALEEDYGSGGEAEPLDELENMVNTKSVKIKELTDEIDHLKKKNEYYKGFIDSIIHILPEEKLLEIAKKELWYTLELKYKSDKGEEPESLSIPRNGNIKIDQTAFDVILMEHTSEFNLLNRNHKIFEKVRLKDYASHIKVIDYNNFIKRTAGDTIDDAVVFQFNDVKKDSEIKLQITDQLKDLLNLEENTITIRIE